MTRREVKMAGFGGQGIILAGYILGKAAAVFENRNAVQTQSYGPEARGGACSADIVIDDDAIDYPLTSKVDVFVAMSEDAYRTHNDCMTANGVLIIDEELVRLNERHGKRKVFRIPATKMAIDLGKRVVTNIVMLGFVTAVTDLVGFEAMKKAVLDSIPKGTEELNLKAFESGYQYGLKARTRTE